MNRIPFLVKPALLVLATLTCSHLAMADIAANAATDPAPIINSGSPGDDPSFSFTFTIGPDTGFGSLDTTNLGGGQFLATAGSLTVTGGADVGTYSLSPGGPGATLSPSGAFIFDNVIYPPSNPALDIDGVLFVGLGLEINIFGDAANTYSFDSWNGSVFNVLEETTGKVTFQATTPEPASVALLASVLAFAGLLISRKRNFSNRPIQK